MKFVTKKAKREKGRENKVICEKAQHVWKDVTNDFFFGNITYLLPWLLIDPYVITKIVTMKCTIHVAINHGLHSFALRLDVGIALLAK